MRWYMLATVKKVCSRGFSLLMMAREVMVPHADAFMIDIEGNTQENQAILEISSPRG